MTSTAGARVAVAVAGLVAVVGGLLAMVPVAADEGVGYDFSCSLGAPITLHGHVPATVEQGGDLVLEEVYLEYTNPVGPVTYAGTRVSVPAPRGTTGPDHVIAVPEEVSLDRGETYRSAASTGAFRVTSAPGAVIELRPADLVVESASTVGGSRLSCQFPPRQPPFASTTVTPSSGGSARAGLGVFPSAETFVAQQHRDLLGRLPTASQSARWVERLRVGVAPTKVVRRLLIAPRSSGVVPPLVRLYLVGLGRRPDHAGLAGWTRRVRSGTPLAGVADAFTTSGENGAGTGLSEEAFVELVHRRAVGRLPAPTARDAWAAGLRSGALERGALVLALAESAEHRARTRPVVDTTVA